MEQHFDNPIHHDLENFTGSNFFPVNNGRQYNLKKQMDDLIDEHDFNKKLQEVNLIVWILTAFMLLSYFIL